MFKNAMRDEFAGEFRGPFFGGGARMGRGMMEPVILRVLLDKPMHGYEIISTLEDKSHGFWRPSAGSVYPTLQLLEEKGHVTVSEYEGKKTYTLTTEGEAEAHKTDHFEQRWTDLNDTHQGASFQDMRKIREMMGSIIKDMRTIQRKGTADQRRKMEELVENLRHELRTTVRESK